MSPGWLASPTRLSPRGSAGLMRLLRTPRGTFSRGVSPRDLRPRSFKAREPAGMCLRASSSTASARLALRLGHAMMQNPKPGQGSGPAAHGTRTSLSRKPPPGSPYSAPTADPGAGTRGPTAWHADMERLTMHRVQERRTETERPGREGELPRPALKQTAGKRLRFPCVNEDPKPGPCLLCRHSCSFWDASLRLLASSAVRPHVRHASGLSSLRGGRCDLPLLVSYPAPHGEGGQGSGTGSPRLL